MAGQDRRREVRREGDRKLRRLLAWARDRSRRATQDIASGDAVSGVTALRDIELRAGDALRNDDAVDGGAG
jgi:hypothetical protein